MRIRIILISGLLVITASLPHAQTSIADGVDAFVRGDYQRAAEILKPLSEQSSQPDSGAEFFMATLYTNGLGVPADAIRGCALYLRASTDRMRSPFAVAAEALVRMLQASLGKDAFDECNWRASVGFDHRFQPVTFTLEPGNWIAWDLKGVTIAYGGEERRLETGFAANRSVFLPIQHTELAVGPSRSVRRHFIEVFRWLPGNGVNSWRLMWDLLEVVRDELILITSQHLVTVAAHEAPSEAFLDVREVVRLVVNESGAPEWTVLSGPGRRTAVIESRSQRH